MYNYDGLNKKLKERNLKKSDLTSMQIGRAHV